MDLADREPYPLDSGSPLYRRFVSAAWHLQHLRGEDTIAIPQTLWADHLKCDQPTVGRLIKQAIEPGLLTVADRHYSPGLRSRLYRFTGAHSDLNAY